MFGACAAWVDVVVSTDTKEDHMDAYGELELLHREDCRARLMEDPRGRVLATHERKQRADEPEEPLGIA